MFGIMDRTRPVVREAILCAGLAAVLASLLLWLGPPGTDFAAHAYQRSAFLQHGFALWNNFWYAGRYSFVTYSVIYYPLAALLGIKLLAVASIAVAVAAFSAVIGSEWGRTARLSVLSFAFVWALVVLTGAFPFLLGFALALVSLALLQGSRRRWFAASAALTLAASPLAFLLLTLILVGVGFARWHDRRRFVPPAAVVGAMVGIEFLLWRLFPDGGRYPFSWQELLAACVFCVAGVALTWRVESARLLCWFFVVYLAGVLAVFAVPSAVGENVARLRFAALPVMVLAFSLRRWRPLPVAFVAIPLVLSWNLTPLAFSFVSAEDNPAAAAAYWQPAIGYLKHHLTPSYRVEAVDTVGHWDAVYLPRAGVPLARGWFRQNDFPQNKLLYEDGLMRGPYLAWLRSLGIKYVVLTDAPSDYSARAEAKLLRSGTSHLIPAWRSRHITIYEVPSPRPLITGPAPAKVVELTQTQLKVDVPTAGTYRIAIRYSPYWATSEGCIDATRDSMIQLRAPQAGNVSLRFHVNARRALATFAGQHPQACSP